MYNYIADIFQLQLDLGNPVRNFDKAPSRAPSPFMTYFQVNIFMAAISHWSDRPTLLFN